MGRPPPRRTAINLTTIATLSELHCNEPEFGIGGCGSPQPLTVDSPKFRLWGVFVRGRSQHRAPRSERSRRGVRKAHDPDRDWTNNAEAQQALAEKLMDLVDTGVRDPRELCSRMLKSFDLDAPH
jgi:hypothetical protein